MHLLGDVRNVIFLEKTVEHTFVHKGITYILHFNRHAFSYILAQAIYVSARYFQ